MISSFDILSYLFFLQPTSPVRAEVDIKLGGTQCNVLMGKLKPLLDIHSSRKKKIVLREGSATAEKSSSSELKVIMWTCTVSAPEMTFVIYSLTNMPLYHVSYLEKKL